VSGVAVEADNFPEMCRARELRRILGRLSHCQAGFAITRSAYSPPGHEKVTSTARMRGTNYRLPYAHHPDSIRRPNYREVEMDNSCKYRDCAKAPEGPLYRLLSRGERATMANATLPVQTRPT